ncbi:hypothetical protein ACHAQA_004267 [Verticillium albo-atrum]
MTSTASPTLAPARRQSAATATATATGDYSINIDDNTMIALPQHAPSPPSPSPYPPRWVPRPQRLGFRWPGMPKKAYSRVIDHERRRRRAADRVARAAVAPASAPARAFAPVWKGKPPASWARVETMVWPELVRRPSNVRPSGTGWVLGIELEDGLPPGEKLGGWAVEEEEEDKEEE